MRKTVEKLDYATRDYDGYKALMIEKLQELMPEYTDTRQSDAGIVILELNAMCLDILSYYLDSIANECFLATAEQRSSVLKFCKMLGYTPRFSTAAHYNQIFIKNDSSVETVIPRGTKVKTYSTIDNVEYYTTTDDLIIPQGAVGDEKVNGEYLYKVDVLHGVYVNGEVLATQSPTSADQRYNLKYAPALVDENFQVTVTDNISGTEVWSRVDSFAGSGPDSKVYVLEINDYNEATVVFGDDLFGAIPKNARITCSYYVGGGISGNVGLTTINTMEDSIANIKGTSNIEQTVHGYDQESVAEIKMNAPLSFRTRWGALTVSDFAGVTTKNFLEVVSAEAKKAEEFGNSDTPSQAVDDIIIYILTQGEVDLEASDNFYIPIPSGFYSNWYYSGLIENITNFFNSDVPYVEQNGVQLDTGRKLAGTRNIIVSHSKIVGLTLNVTLMAEKYYEPSDVTENVMTYIKNYFKLGNIPFNTDISLVDLIYSTINDSGIKGIQYLNLDVDGVKDENEEIHNADYQYVNKDLIIPAIGVIIALEDANVTIRTR